LERASGFLTLCNSEKREPLFFITYFAIAAKKRGWRYLFTDTFSSRVSEEYFCFPSTGSVGDDYSRLKDKPKIFAFKGNLALKKAGY
jgi:hypothetical protein